MINLLNDPNYDYLHCKSEEGEEKGDISSNLMGSHPYIINKY